MPEFTILEAPLTIEPEWCGEEEKTLGMLVAVIREQDNVLLLAAYGPPWDQVLENGYDTMDLLADELKPPSDGVWIGAGDFSYRASGGWECPHEDFEVTFRGEWRKPIPEEWERLKRLDAEYMWEKKDLPLRPVKSGR